MGDYSNIVQAISTVGFPIVCCLVMGWYVKYQTDKNRQDMLTLIEQRFPGYQVDLIEKFDR